MYNVCLLEDVKPTGFSRLSPIPRGFYTMTQLTRVLSLNGVSTLLTEPSLELNPQSC